MQTHPNADPLSLERIATVHPLLRAELRAQYLRISAELPAGLRLRVTQAYRSAARQDALYAKGRTAPGTRVTNAPGGRSMHNYGLAFDIVLLRLEGGTWAADWTVGPEWKQVAAHFRSCGWTWGGDWKSLPDAPHFEKTFGHTWRSLQELPKKTDANGLEYPIFNGQLTIDN